MRTKKGRLFWPTVVVLLAILASAVVFLGACGEPDGPVVPTETPQPPATPTVTPTPTMTPTPTATPDPAFPMHTIHFSFGLDLHLYYMDYDRVMGYAGDLGVEWVRQQVYWQDIEGAKGSYVWDELDNVVAAVGRHNRKLLVSIVRAPSWATVDGGYGMPADPNDLGDFLSAMATRYRGQIQAYEIWNEQNYAIENDGYVADAGRYVELLKVAFSRIKEADPHAMVLFGPLTPTGVNDPEIAVDDIAYLEQIYEYEGGIVRDYFDVLAAHVAGSNNPPDTLWPENPGPGEWTDHSSHYFRHVENVRAVMEAYGDADKQIWITEFGWASIEGITDTPAPGYEYAAENMAQQQADYLVQALETGRTTYQPWMGAMFVWNLNFAPITPPTDEKAAFGLLNSAWEPRLSYGAVKGYIQQYTQWPD
jgi:hypothetical protein